MFYLTCWNKNTQHPSFFDLHRTSIDKKCIQDFNALVLLTKLFHLISNVKTETKDNILYTSKISENTMHTFGKHPHRKDKLYIWLVLRERT